MKSSLRFTSLIVAAAALCMAAASTAYRQTADAVCTFARAFKNVVLDGFKLAAQLDSGKALAVVPFVQAKAFVLRIIKRERPEVSTSWRMCPSV